MRLALAAGLMALLVVSAANVARADEPSGALAPPPPGSAEEPKAHGTSNFEVMSQRWVDRPLVLPPLVARADLAIIGAGGAPYSVAVGFIPSLAMGVATGLELSFSVPVISDLRIEPRFGAHYRFFASKEADVGVRAIFSVPTGPDDATADIALTLAWRVAPWLRIDTEARGGFAFSSYVATAFDWPLIFTFQASPGFFLGATSELAVFPDLGRATYAAGAFFGGTLEQHGHALCDLRLGAAARDLASSSVGLEVVAVVSFYGDAR